MKRFFVALVCVAMGLFLSVGYSAIAQVRSTPTNTNNMMSVDRQFMMTAGEAGLANIAMGQMALQKATNPAVKQFAEAEIAEQQQVKQNLTRLAPRMGVTLPTTPGPKYQALMTRLSQLSGEQFDQAYLHEGGVNAHLENASTFQREAQFGQVPEVVAIANQGLPTIQLHFNTASRLTDYNFAQVSRRFNAATSGTPQSNNRPTSPATPVVR